MGPSYNRDYMRARYADPVGRVRTLLIGMKYRSKKRGYAPCTTPPEEVAATITDTCEICGRSEEELGHKLHIDHCHVTGHFRGWLCKPCNTALGQLGDQLEPIMAYLTKRDNSRQRL